MPRRKDMWPSTVRVQYPGCDLWGPAAHFTSAPMTRGSVSIPQIPGPFTTPWGCHFAASTILHILWLPSRRSLAEAIVASQGRAARPPRAAGLLLARAEALPREQEGGKAGRSAGERERIFVFGGPKPKIFPLEASRRFVPAACGGRLGAKRANPQSLASRLPAFLLIPARSPRRDERSAVT